MCGVKMNRVLTGLSLAVMLLVSGWGAVSAGQKNMGGWELGSAYNQLYDAAEVDSFKAYVESFIDIKPLEGMSEGIGVIVRDIEDEKVVVHLGPKSYLGSSKNLGLRKGDRVKIKGCWADLEDEEIFIASKIKKGDVFELKVRLTSNGKPFWTMEPDELAREKAKK